jgi:dihydrofolate reductase
VIGSLDLLQSLLRLDLVDQLNLWVHPVVLGSGKRAFGDGAVPRALRLTDSRTYTGGVVQLTYENAGEPRYGDMTSQDEQRRGTGA